MFQAVFNIIHWFIQTTQPLLIPVCLIFAWMLVFIVAWSIWAAIRDGIANAKQMHRIPCANCQFFTGDYHLKCSVRPTIALSEAAINCPDYKL